MVAFRKYLCSILLVSLAVCSCRSRERVENARHELSDTKRVSHANAKRLLSAKKLSSDDVKVLIRDFRDEPYNRIAVPMGSWLLTGHTPETRVLLKQPIEAYPQLVKALDDPSIDVRRYAAFCLGEMRRKGAIPHLQRALDRELAFAVSDRSAGLRWPNAAVDAIIRAHARIDRRSLVEGLLRSSSPVNEMALVNQNLAWLMPSGPDCERVTPSECRQRWLGYWQANKERPDDELFGR